MEPNQRQAEPLLINRSDKTEQEIEEETTILGAMNISDNDDEKFPRTREYSKSGVFSIPQEDPPNNCKSKSTHHVLLLLTWVF